MAPRAGVRDMETGCSGRDDLWCERKTGVIGLILIFCLQIQAPIPGPRPTSEGYSN